MNKTDHSELGKTDFIRNFLLNHLVKKKNLKLLLDKVYTFGNPGICWRYKTSKSKKNSWKLSDFLEPLLPTGSQNFIFVGWQSLDKNPIQTFRRHAKSFQANNVKTISIPKKLNFSHFIAAKP